VQRRLGLRRGGTWEGREERVREREAAGFQVVDFSTPSPDEKSVKSAERFAGYEVALDGPSGGIDWAGWATGTSIPVGGEPLIDRAFSGPSVSAGMTWSVAAYDADGTLVR
jgi:hypothetical protein